VLPVSRAEVAEAAKLVENVYRAVNIALVDLFFFLVTFFGALSWLKMSTAP
jgi:UDP-N-acetyl-D-mannosaminuronate dehydrogenase